VTIGADRRLDQDLVAGFNLSYETSRSSGFGGELRNESSGFNFGPHLGARLSSEWTLDASLGLGLIDNDTQISVLSGHYTTQRYSGTLTASGLYHSEKTQVRPKASVYYGYFKNEAYDMSGTIAGIPVVLPVAKDSFDFGTTELSAEVSQLVRLSGGKVVVPYAEAGVRYEFARPNAGQILTGSLTQVTASPWSGSLRVGARVLLTRSTFIEASAGYLSFMQNGFDLWEGKIFLSHGF